LIYDKTVTVKDGRQCRLRNGTFEDGEAVLHIFRLTHSQTDWLLSLPDEKCCTVEQESEFLKGRTDSPDEIEIVAKLDGRIVGTAGINCVNRRIKVRHRAEFGISVDRALWGLGIGRALTRACIECARQAEYLQLELDVVADNHRAIGLYESEGFIEYGRNPRGFRLPDGRWQELVLMRLELD
jgi:RimJ/RimL family protein N-acetyltransferase